MSTVFPYGATQTAELKQQLNLGHQRKSKGHVARGHVTQ